MHRRNLRGGRFQRCIRCARIDNAVAVGCQRRRYPCVLRPALNHIVKDNGYVTAVDDPRLFGTICHNVVDRDLFIGGEANDTRSHRGSNSGNQVNVGGRGSYVNVVVGKFRSDIGIGRRRRNGLCGIFPIRRRGELYALHRAVVSKLRHVGIQDQFIITQIRPRTGHVKRSNLQGGLQHKIVIVVRGHRGGNDTRCDRGVIPQNISCRVARDGDTTGSNTVNSIDRITERSHHSRDRNAVRFAVVNHFNGVHRNARDRRLSDLQVLRIKGIRRVVLACFNHRNDFVCNHVEAIILQDILRCATVGQSTVSSGSKRIGQSIGIRSVIVIVDIKRFDAVSQHRRSGHSQAFN